MSLWIKICGNTSLEDAMLAAEFGADAASFVFAASPRQVSREQVAEIVPRLPGALEKIGVFVDSSFDEIDSIVRSCQLTGVQLHFDASSILRDRLRERFGPNLHILQVLHFATDVTARAAALVRDENIDALLVDSRTANAAGGTGTAYDWNAAIGLFRSDVNAFRLVAAGGLTPENVSQAISTLRPWGVDVVSGVEAAPGRKDPEKIRKFISRARAASVPAK